MDRLNHAGRRPAEDKREHFAFRLEQSRIEWLRDEAFTQGVTVSEFARELLGRAIKAYQRRTGR